MSKRNGKARVPKDKFRYVRCQVEPGMFREEWLVYFNAVDPTDPQRTIRVQSLVDSRSVIGIRGTPKRKNPAEGLLRVTFVEQKAGFAWIVLPQPAVPVGENVLVHKEALEQEAGV